MNVDAINAIPRRAAAASLEALKEQYARLAPKIAENAKAVLSALTKAKPASAKGVYLKSISMSSTMGPGIKIDASQKFTVASI